MSQKWGLRHILWKQMKQMLCQSSLWQTKQGGRSGDRASGGVEASGLTALCASFLRETIRESCCVTDVL